MTDQTLEQKSVELLDKADGAITAFAEKLGDLAEQYGPEVADAALMVARVDAANAVLPPLVLLLFVFAPLAIISPFSIRRAVMLDKAGNTSGMAIVYGSGGIIGCLVGGMGALTCLFATFNLWAWVGIFEPKLWIAKKVLGL